eukprot:TRINITY_DN18436_c0_g1_i1.p1 TRINITY_DN18436_c0_g1~~TRINITY_DN18436_c0_g1_i1.p1  ORF type:complete len:107 (+),score=10.32 TRINITY_DN18436_c0_g1_i1:2-322(+)
MVGSLLGRCGSSTTRQLFISHAQKALNQSHDCRESPFILSWPDYTNAVSLYSHLVGRSSAAPQPDNDDVNGWMCADSEVDVWMARLYFCASEYGKVVDILAPLRSV